MTENEALEIFRDTTLCIPLREASFILLDAFKELEQYHSIGTVSECREAMEKQRAKEYKLIHPCKSVNYYQCPVCDGLLHINENYCGNCGQRISWERDNE